MKSKDTSTIKLLEALRILLRGWKTCTKNNSGMFLK